MSLLHVNSVTGGYGQVTVLRDLSVELQSDERLGLFGPNGHGKSTLLKMISGLIRPSTGSIHFDGNAIDSASPSSIVARGLVHSQQANTLFGDMRIGEILEMSAFVQRAKKDAASRIKEVYQLFPRLDERRRQRARTLSGGERQMLSIGAALMCAPRLLMLDEPTLGLSPLLKEELTAALADISKRVPMIIVEQDIELLLTVTDRQLLIEHGQVVHEITKDNAPDYQEIVAMYFGEHH